eukprot:TRINITY_DN29364_c0_g1_i1.p1 TRINITY_DN29364_c0_g1~~TRINITY_DN29364_c0_g1_i1.p1  ORF type:complete len:288 (-),score=29.97 TRINITY_DN29364_c0_g1_i1:118-981(-)
MFAAGLAMLCAHATFATRVPPFASIASKGSRSKSASKSASKSSTAKPRLDSLEGRGGDDVHEGHVSSEQLAELEKYGGSFGSSSHPPKGLMDLDDCEDDYANFSVVGVSEYCGSLDIDSRNVVPFGDRLPASFNVTRLVDPKHCMLVLRVQEVQRATLPSAEGDSHFSLEFGSSHYKTTNGASLSQITCNDLNEFEGDRAAELDSVSATEMKSGTIRKKLHEVPIEPLPFSELKLQLRAFADEYYQYGLTTWNCQLFTAEMASKLTGETVVRANERILKNFVRLRGK